MSVLVALLNRPVFLERKPKSERRFGWPLRRFTLDTVFMHLGAGDCRLARLAASYVERVYAVDAIDNLAGGALPPGNLRPVRSDDLGAAVPEGSFDVPRRIVDGQTIIDFVRVSDSRTIAGIYEGICW
jgi:hypothetical protein